MRECVHPGEVWRELIEEAGVSQTSVARRMGVSQPYLNHVITGYRMPNAVLTVKFARAMGASVKLLWQVAADYELDRALREVESDEVEERVSLAERVARWQARSDTDPTWRVNYE